MTLAIGARIERERVRERERERERERAIVKSSMLYCTSTRYSVPLRSHSRDPIAIRFMIMNLGTYGRLIIEIRARWRAMRPA